MTDIVERLRELERVERELAHDCDCPPEATANWRYAETCKSAADEIEKLRAALEAWNHAVRIDVLMEGPRYMGVSGEAGRRAWELTRTALKEDGE